MARRELIRRPDVKDCNEAIAHAGHELVAGDGLHAVAYLKIGTPDTLDFGKVTFSDIGQHAGKPEDGVVCQPVSNEFTVAAGRNQTCPPKLLQMLGCIGD